MSSALNHCRRSRRNYEKRVSAMNTLKRKNVIKEHRLSFSDLISMLQKRRQNRFKKKALNKSEK